jgi:filamentous hemagglutinin family protein
VIARLAMLLLLALLSAAAHAQFGPEVRLSNIQGPSISPRLAAGTAADNLLHAVWSEYAVGGTQQILYSRSTNNGDSWSQAAPLSSTATAVVPAIAANGNKVVVTWTDTIVGGELYYRISADGGASWIAPPQVLFPAAGYSRPSGVLVDNAGRIHVAWFDSRATGYGQLYYTMSCDNGGSWSPLQRVNPQDDGIDNESPRLAEGADGTIYMLYRSSRDGNPQRGWPPFDHYLLRSTALVCGGGAAWLYPSQRVSRGLPEDLGNTYGGQIVAGQSGRMHIAWWRESSGNNLAYRGGFPKPASGAVPGFGNSVDVSRFGPNHLEFDLNTAESGGFGLGEDTANVTHMVFAENNHLNNGFQVGPLYYARSTDAGASFEPKQAAATGSETAQPHGLYHNGRFHMIWADFRDNNQGSEIYYRNLPTVAAPMFPGPANISANPYGGISVQGAFLSGSTITFAPGNAVIQLGTTPGTPGSFVKLDFQGFNIASGSTLTIRSGAAGQKVVLFNADASASVIGGTLQGAGGNGAPPAEIYLHNPNGITVNAGGAVSSASGVTIDTLGVSPSVGQSMTNAGVIDGGSALRLLGARITGGGAYKGDNVFISSFGNVNNPVNGSHFLANSLQLYPSAGANVALTLNDYGTAPQVLNVMINGNGTAQMPTAWPPSDPTIANNAPVPMGGSRPPGAPEPGFGGGSVIVQSTGSLTLAGGTSNDFAFAGGIVLKALGTLDLNGVLVNQGWTTTGKAFQGVFFESPNIISTAGNIQVLSNNLNWINFSTLPHAPVRTWQLALAGDGSAQYVNADLVAPHLNTYSLLIETAAAGGCWVCLVNTQPVNMQ